MVYTIFISPALKCKGSAYRFNFKDFHAYTRRVYVNRMVKAAYSMLKKIVEITGAKDILIERTVGDNLAEIKLMIPK